jgi:ankyrin repeat protein
MPLPVELLLDAAVHDHPAARLLIQQDPAVLDAKDGLGETALHYLAVEGFLEAVQFLAEAGADVNAPNKFGDSALTDAAVLGNAEMVKLLLRLGANPNIQSLTRDSAVHAAANSGSAEALDALLAAGARADYVTELEEMVWDAVANHPEHREQLEAVLRRHGVPPAVEAEDVPT